MKLAIVVVEDEPEVRDAVLGDLAPFADTVRIEPAEGLGARASLPAVSRAQSGGHPRDTTIKINPNSRLLQIL